jgi:hypothetical protein
MLQHSEQLRGRGFIEARLLELLEAALRIGIISGVQSKNPSRNWQWNRPIYVLSFDRDLVAVAITVTSVGYVVGMKLSGVQDALHRLNMSKEELKRKASWPVPSSFR